jgi:hypothetical protein
MIMSGIQSSRDSMKRHYTYSQPLLTRHWQCPWSGTFDFLETHEICTTFEVRSWRLSKFVQSTTDRARCTARCGHVSARLGTVQLHARLASPACSLLCIVLDRAAHAAPRPRESRNGGPRITSCVFGVCTTRGHEVLWLDAVLHIAAAWKVAVTSDAVLT